MKPNDDIELEELSEDSFEEILSQYRPIKFPWKELPLPDISNPETIAQIEKNPYPQSLAVRRHAKNLLDEGKVKEAFELAEKPISEIKSLLETNNNRKLIPFLVFLYENIGWLVNQLPNDKKSLYVDIGMKAIKEAHDSGKSVYGVSLYNRIEILTQWVNLLTAKVRSKTISDCLKEIQTIESEFSNLFKKRKWLGFNEIKKTIDFRIALNKFYYKACRKTKYLKYSLTAKKILVSALEDWLKYLNPTCKSNGIKLEHNLKPTKNWTKFEQENVEKKIEKKLSQYSDRFNDETVQNIKSTIVELLFAVANTYLRLGHHSHAHRLLRIINIYGVGKNGTLEQKLNFVINMANIEENENLLKAIDRLELILQEIEAEGNHQQLKGLTGYIHKLEQLYSRMGLQDIAIYLCKRFGKGQTVKLQKDEKEVKKEIALDKLICLIRGNLEKEKPIPIIHSIENLAKYLMSLGYEDAINEKLEQIKALRVDVNSFIKKWIQFTEIRELRNLKYGLFNELGSIPGDPKSYAEIFFNLAVILCEMFNHALLPQFLRHLAISQKESGNPSWIKNMVYSCLMGAKFGDPVNFVKSFEEIKGLLSQSKVSSDEIPEYLCAKLFKDTIVFCESIIERIFFAKARFDFIEKISPNVDIATFGLCSLNIDNKASWIFRGANLLKARVLTGLRLEIPSKLKKEDWLRLRELQLLESELITLNENNTEMVNINDEEKILQEKYNLFLKINDCGISGCYPKYLKKILHLYEKMKKICVVSFLLSGEKLLATGVSNYSDTWFVTSEIDVDINELTEGCWDDIECKGDVAGEHGGIRNLKEAFTILISPIIDHIQKSELLYIIPCEGLHNFPFHALYGLIDRKEQFLIERYEIAYLPSPLLLWRLSKDDDIPVINGKDKGLAFGCLDDNIGWGKRKEELSEFGIVTEDNPSHGFKKLIESKQTRKVLYLVGHGYLPEKGQSPFNAHVSLTGIDKADVIEISARQFAELGPKARFVFLNSCWLGYGIGHGRDAYGFPFSIIGSANSSCLVSASRVDIEFAHFFAKMVFKFIFQDSIDRSTAITEVMRRCIRSPEKPEWNIPYYWAPYFFYGDFRPL